MIRCAYGCLDGRVGDIMVGDSMMARGICIVGDIISLVHERYIYYIKFSEVFTRRTCM